MPHPHWPFFDLRVRTPRLELRYPDDDLLLELARVAAGGVHAPDRMPFTEPWTRNPPGELEVKALQFWWGQRARLTPEDWNITFAVIEGSQVVGCQGLFSKDFAVRRSVESGSWLGLEHQGQGIGTEMRAAVLHLAFEGLRAEIAETGAFADNPESQGVTRKLGYEPNGTFTRAREGKAAEMRMFRMTRSQWATQRRVDLTIEGLAPCLPALGLEAPPRTEPPL
jgi:RimJ/RimL family protein N-acetyltransferase